MKYEKIAKEIACDIVKKMQANGLGREDFVDLMVESYMVSILTYCRIENVDPLETLTLFHEKAEEISLKGHDEAKEALRRKCLI